MSEVDILALQEQAEKIVREEYQKSFDELEKQKNQFSDMRNMWIRTISSLELSGTAQSQMTLTGGVTDEALSDIVAKINDAVTEHAKLTKMLKAINSNPITQKQWNQLVMTLRLTGGDEVDDQAD